MIRNKSLLLINEILNKLKNENNYSCLEEDIFSDINNKEKLYYSLVLYEQKKEFNVNPSLKNKHITYWKTNYLRVKNNFNNGSWSRYKKECLNYKPKLYPISLNFECTTYCNAKCKNCTHEELIVEEVRKLRHANKEDIFYSIRKSKLMTLINDVPPEAITLCAVGLGEPLLYPHIYEVYKYMRMLFPKSYLNLNTNISMLNSENSRRLLECNLDHIYLSLSYFDKQDYIKYIGIREYDQIIINIITFLKLKRARRPAVSIHIFDNDINTNKIKYRFTKFFRPYLNSNDNLVFYPYEKLTDKMEIKARKIKKNAPCSQLWQVLMIDVDGNCFPCCLGVWKKYDENLCIGNIYDSIGVLQKNLYTIRSRHIEGEFGTCSSCEYLSNPQNKTNYSRLLDFNKNKSKCISGNIPWYYLNVGNNKSTFAKKIKVVKFLLEGRINRK